MKSSNEISTGSSNSSTVPSTSRLGGHRAHDEFNRDTTAVSSSSSCDAKDCASISSLIKYRSSISDLGGSSTALDRLTNTRIKSIKNRRGAVKYQKYVSHWSGKIYQDRIKL